MRTSLFPLLGFIVNPLALPRALESSHHTLLTDSLATPLFTRFRRGENRRCELLPEAERVTNVTICSYCERNATLLEPCVCKIRPRLSLAGDAASAARLPTALP